ncbi:MAG: LamB/YcsF family protein [Nocardioidaceae bacterium]|nr:LamB/YcsF family protein [Nocardioidaceae bacterium]
MAETVPRVVSLNADIGEGYGAWTVADDAALLAVVTDANVACGFHAGDPDILRRTCEAAAAHGVGVGAQVGFGDLRGFGRRFIELPRASLVNDVLYQVGALAALASVAGTRVSYVKAHGALHHAASSRDEYAAAIVEAMLAYGGGLRLLSQPGTRLAAHAQGAGLRVVAEGFVDRGYSSDGLLVPRGHPGAFVTDRDAACRQALAMGRDGTVGTVDGETCAMPVQSLCVHSDSPGAVEVASAVRQALEAAGVALRSLV